MILISDLGVVLAANHREDGGHFLAMAGTGMSLLQIRLIINSCQGHLSFCKDTFLQQQSIIDRLAENHSIYLTATFVSHKLSPFSRTRTRMRTFKYRNSSSLRASTLLYSTLSLEWDS
jgi:hypothetical protein